MSGMLFLGIDVGTSGVRAIAVDASGNAAGQGSAKMADFGADPRDPALWKTAAIAALDQLFGITPRERIAALSVDGTSGTVLAIDANGAPIAAPMMYNEPVMDKAVIDAIARHAPETSAALGANSALARAIVLQGKGKPSAARIVHQADWIAGLISGRFDLSDANNALKTGYDPVAAHWPGWIGATGMRMDLLPDVVEPGRVTGCAKGVLAREVGLPAEALVVAGTTDGCASFLATGAARSGDAVTALGTTLTVKLLGARPIFAPQYGIYSHRIAGGWLAGGASNTGGNVIAAHFDDASAEILSAGIDPQTDTGLNYYPLLKPGERFPINDPVWPPRMEPRPADDATFLKAILEGIASAEALGYARLAELGAPAIRSVRTVGGGARNAAWSRIRQRKLGVPFLPAISAEAAHGTALLALSAMRRENAA
jgi:sugar (pentulose or hexulose) kinase